MERTMYGEGIGIVMLVVFGGGLWMGAMLGYCWGRDDERKRDKNKTRRQFVQTVRLPFKRLDERAIIPTYAHEGDSGMDLYALDNMCINRYAYARIHTGIACEIPDGYELQVRPRSGLAAKKGVVAAFGTVDTGYRGEIGVTFFNHSRQAVEIAAGDRIAQVVLAPVVRAEVVETQTLSQTERGTGGFGSTGA